MFIAILCMIAALALYSLAIWSERIKHDLRAWMVMIFSIGFACDLIGTSIMTNIAQSNGGTKFSVHTCCGFVALGIMLLHLVWAYIAISRHGQAEKMFHRYSIYAWMIWFIAFATGIPK